MEITVLTENSAMEGLESEHGLSFWIRIQDQTILLDAGSSGIFETNGKKLGIAVETARMAVLSHGHYDHAGGLETWIRKNTRGKIYAREGVFGEFYSLTTGLPRYIGIPGKIKESKHRFCILKENRELLPGIWTVGHENRDFTRRAEQEHMYEMHNGNLEPDRFFHEQSLVLDQDGGVVILSSCSHAGILQTIREVTAVFPGKPVRCVAGGFHLKGGKDSSGSVFSEDEIRSLGKELKNLDIPEIYTGHCTGSYAYDLLKEILGGRLHRLYAGRVIRL